MSCLLTYCGGVRVSQGRTTSSLDIVGLIRWHWVVLEDPGPPRTARGLWRKRSLPLKCLGIVGVMGICYGFLITRDPRKKQVA